MKTITKEELVSHIGSKLDSSDWYVVSQKQIDQFADCTHDHQFIHVDPVKAKDSPFGSTIAHGFLSLSMLGFFNDAFALNIENAYMGVNYGFNKIRFLSPVKVNSRIRCHALLKDAIEKKPGQFMLTYDVEIEIEHIDKPALKAEWIVMQVVKND